MTIENISGISQWGVHYLEILTQNYGHFVLSRGVRNYIAAERLTVESDLTYSLADSVRILYSDFVNGSAETAGYSVFLPLGADTRIDLKAVVCRLYTQNILGDGIPVPGSSSGKPAVLGLARTGCILAGDHLRINVWLDLVKSAVLLGV